MADETGFKDDQKHFLQGFAMGADVARAVRGLPILSGSATAPGTTVAIGTNGAVAQPAKPSGPFPLQVEAQDRFIAQGKSICKEEQAKREKDPFSMWDEIGANA